MIRAIVLKELRETRAFAALALVLYSVYLSKLTGTWNRLLARVLSWVPGTAGGLPDFPFVQDGFGAMFGSIGFALAIALGFRQSAWEPSQGTALYLLHRPLPRRAIILAKVLTGLGLQLACTLVPIVAYAAWAATPGTHAAPFEWSMIGPTLHLWLVMPLAYLGAFASGIRPARWFGTRLLPLVAVAIPSVFLLYVPRWGLLGPPMLLIAASALISDILLEAETRDY